MPLCFFVFTSVPFKKRTQSSTIVTAKKSSHSNCDPMITTEKKRMMVRRVASHAKRATIYLSQNRPHAPVQMAIAIGTR